MPGGTAPTLDSARWAGVRLVDSAAQATNRTVGGLKAFLGINLFLWHIDAFEKEEDPTEAFIRLCDTAAALLASTAPLTAAAARELAKEQTAAMLPADLGALYGAVYPRMSDEEYFDESREVLRARLEANEIDLVALFGGKTIVDAGCGGGKFTQAIAVFGADSVIGIDLGEGNIAYARRQAAKVPHGTKIRYAVGSVLDLPIEDDTADFVWCNSVGHVSGDQDACLAELARILRPGGTLFYYVNGRFGLFETLLCTLQGLMKNVPHDVVQHHLQAMSVAAGRISWMMACFFAPYEFKPRAEIEALLTRNGFGELQLLTRGIETDFCEKIARGSSFAEVKYGEGQLKYLAKKA